MQLGLTQTVSKGLWVGGVLPGSIWDEPLDVKTVDTVRTSVINQYVIDPTRCLLIALRFSNLLAPPHPLLAAGSG